MMTTKKYRKAEVKIIDPPSPQDLERNRRGQARAEKKKRKPRTKRSKRTPVSSSKIAKNITNTLSLALVILGVGVLTYSLYPFAEHYAKKLFRVDTDQNVLGIGGGGDGTSLQSRQSPQYFQNVDTNIALISQELEGTNADYSDLEGVFYLTVPKIDLDRVPVKLNVNSFDGSEYDSVLESKLAHFEGSSVPGKVGTTFVYGHSTAEWFADANPNFFGAVFTYLPQMNIGDGFSVEWEGVTYDYVVTRVHEIEPTDLSPVFENDGRRLFKMMTCTPVGVGTDRLIVVGEQI